MSYTNKVTKDRYAKCFSDGREIEKLFSELVSAQGKSVKKSTAAEDMSRHIDYWVDGYGVDVKANRHNATIWLETVNVRGDKGWLQGDATFIAFHFTEENEFRIFLREELLDFVLSNNIGKTTSKKDYLKIYTREKWGKKDEIMKVKYDHIKHLRHTIMKC